MAPTLSPRWFLLAFLIVMALVALFSISTFSRVRYNATIADQNIRVVAWALLVHADRHGSFPTDASALFTERFADTLSTLVSDDGSWPTNFAETEAGAAPDRPGTWSRQVREGLRTTRIRRPIEGDGPLRLDTPGHGTLHGTVDRVNDWLAAAHASVTPAP